MQGSGIEKERSYDLIVFDNDGTLNTESSCWKYTHEAFGSYQSHGRALLKHHLQFRTPYDAYARENVALWKGRHREKFIDIIRVIPLREGAVQVLRYLRAKGYLLGIMSSGFSFWQENFIEEYGIGFDFFRANEIQFENNDICTGEIVLKTTDNVPGKDKGSIITQETEALGISLDRTVMIGDGWGDVAAMKLAGKSYCVGENYPEVREAADEWLGDSLLPLLEKL